MEWNGILCHEMIKKVPPWHEVRLMPSFGRTIGTQVRSFGRSDLHVLCLYLMFN